MLLTPVNLLSPFCGSDNPLIATTNADFPRVKFSLADGSTRQLRVGTGVTHPMAYDMLTRGPAQKWPTKFKWAGPTEGP